MLVTGTHSSSPFARLSTTGPIGGVRTALIEQIGLHDHAAVLANRGGTSGHQATQGDDGWGILATWSPVSHKHTRPPPAGRLTLLSHSSRFPPGRRSASTQPSSSSAPDGVLRDACKCVGVARRARRYCNSARSCQCVHVLPAPRRPSRLLLSVQLLPTLCWRSGRGGWILPVSVTLHLIRRLCCLATPPRHTHAHARTHTHTGLAEAPAAQLALARRHRRAARGPQQVRTYVQ